MVAVSMKGGNEEGGVVVKGVVSGDGEQEVLLDVFVLWAPDFLTTFINNSVLVWMVSDSSGAGQGSEKMGEELGFQGDREWEINKDGGGWGGRGDNCNGGFDDGRREVFNGDVGERDSFDNFFKL
jgi:hypothetical protein